MARSPWGTVNAGFSSTTTLDRRNWDLTYNAALETGGVLIGNELQVNIELELTKEDSEEAVEEEERAMEATEQR